MDYEEFKQQFPDEVNLDEGCMTDEVIQEEISKVYHVYWDLECQCECARLPKDAPSVEFHDIMGAFGSGSYSWFIIPYRYKLKEVVFRTKNQEPGLILEVETEEEMKKGFAWKEDVIWLDDIPMRPIESLVEELKKATDIPTKTEDYYG